MKVEAILKKPVNPPIEKIVVELTPEEARGIFNQLGLTSMKSSEPGWQLWFLLRKELGIDAQPGFESP